MLPWLELVYRKEPVEAGVNVPKWLQNRELGSRPPVGTGNSMHQTLYRATDVQSFWDPRETGDRHYGGIFNFDFSTDGSALVAACEGRSFLVFDPLSHKLVKAREDAHADCVNCIRFLDTRTFATCSDDTTVALWDLRFLKNNIRVFVGHSNWVKNIEYASSKGLLVTSAFDGKVFTWNINNFSKDEGCKQVFNSNGLMRCKLTPDDSQLIVSTSKGHLMVIHDLDLDTLEIDMEAFTRGQLSETMSSFNSLLDRPTNRLEIINDFPADDIAEIIASLQVHPQGWCIASRNTNGDVNEWTCIHDIQAQPLAAGVEGDEQMEEEESEEAKLAAQGSSARTRSTMIVTGWLRPTINTPGPQRWPFALNRRTPRHELLSHPRHRPVRATPRLEDMPVEQLLQVRDPDHLLCFPNNDEDDATSSDEEPQEFEVDSGSEDMATDGDGGSNCPNPGGMTDDGRVPARTEQAAGGEPLPSGTDAYSFFLWSRWTRQWPSRRNNYSWHSTFQDRQRTVPNLRSRRNPSWVMSRQQNRRDLLYNLTHPRYKSAPRLIHYSLENTSGRGYIKEQCFSTDGRILVSPYGNGIRLLSFDRDCRELCDCEPSRPEEPQALHILKHISIHSSVVLTTRCSPTQQLMVTGAMDGSIAFLRPEF